MFMFPYNEKRCNLEVMSVEILHNLNDGNLGCLNSFRFSIWGYYFSNPSSDFVFSRFWVSREFDRGYGG